jgi:chitinase
MLSSVVLSSLLFSSFVRCAPTPDSGAGFDGLQTTGIARHPSISSHNMTSAATSQSPSSDGALYTQSNAMPYPSNPAIRPANVVLSVPIDFPSSQGVNDSTKPLVMAYYPDWAGPTCSPESINFPLFDWIDFAFALPDETSGLVWDSEEATRLLVRLVRSAHAAGTKVKLSIGGWTGSKCVS